MGTHRTLLVPHHEHKACPLPLETQALLVESRETTPVLLEAVHEPPVLNNAQPLGHHGADLLGHSATEEAGRTWRVGAVAVQDKRFQGRRTEGAGGAVLDGVEDAVDTIPGRHGGVVVVDGAAAEEGAGVTRDLRRVLAREAPYEPPHAGSLLALRLWGDTLRPGFVVVVCRLFFVFLFLLPRTNVLNVACSYCRGRADR